MQPSISIDNLICSVTKSFLQLAPLFTLRELKPCWYRIYVTNVSPTGSLFAIRAKHQQCWSIFSQAKVDCWLHSRSFLVDWYHFSSSTAHDHGYSASVRKIGSLAILVTSISKLTIQNSHGLSDATKAGLHLLIPATSSNPEFCKLLLSTTILGYPTPILINYGAKEAPNPYVQHLAKVETLLHYLNRLKPISNDDIVLILDGYDGKHILAMVMRKRLTDASLVPITPRCPDQEIF